MEQVYPKLQTNLLRHKLSERDTVPFTRNDYLDIRAPYCNGYIVYRYL